MLHYTMELLRKLGSRFSLYILKELVITLFVSIGVLTFLLVLGRLGKMTELVINKGVGLADILFLILYSIPPYLTFTLPMAFLLSVIVVLGRLSSESEILILKSSGVDLRKLFVPITALALFISGIGILNTNLLVPRSVELFRTALIDVIKRGVSVDDKEGIFNDTIPGVVLYINKVDSEKRILSGIVISDDRDKEIKQTISARKGYINIDPDTFDLYFALEDGSLHRWEKAKDTYSTISFDDYTFSMNLSSMIRFGGELRKSPYEMNRQELRNALKTEEKPEKRYRLMLEVYNKISVPLSPLAFILLSVPLSVSRRMDGKFTGTLYSLLVFIFYYILMAATESIGRAVRLHVAATAFLPDAVVVAIGIYLLKDINKEERATIQDKIVYFWKFCFEKTR